MKFFINPVDLTDSTRLYSIDDEQGNRIASTTEEAGARQLRDALNSKGANLKEVVADWNAANPSDRIFNGFIYGDAK